MNKMFLSWNEIQDSCIEISKKLKKLNISFDCILCVGRGGMVPSRILSEYLNIKDIYIFNISMYKDMKISDVRFIEFDCNVLHNKNVLIVDDVATTCSTINHILDYIKSIGILPISTTITTVFRNINCKTELNIVYDEEYDADNTWIVFPWEKE